MSLAKQTLAGLLMSMFSMEIILAKVSPNAESLKTKKKKT